MSLIKCPGCGKEISDKAKMCPHCLISLENNDFAKSSNKKTKNNDIDDKFETKRNKNINYKNINIFLIIVLIVSIIVNIVQYSQIKKIKKEDYNINALSETSVQNDTKAVSGKDNSIANDNFDKENKRSISLNETIKISTETGDFNLTIENVRTCDWMERNNDDASGEFRAVVVECDVENINYTDPTYTTMNIWQYFNIVDSEGYVVDILSYSYDDTPYATHVEIREGSKGKVFKAYKVGKNIKILKIDINRQYELEVNIE